MNGPEGIAQAKAWLTEWAKPSGVSWSGKHAAVILSALAEKDRRIAELERELERIHKEVFPDHQRNVDYWGKRADDAEARIAAQWLPIETAPRDGTDFLVWDGFEIEIAKWPAHAPMPANGWEAFECASHWMRLPIPPPAPDGGSETREPSP